MWRARPRWPLSTAALLCLAALAIRWPGVAMYDSVSQYDQALAGAYADWHPPIMARLWSVLLRVWPGTAPMLLLQMLLWWGGLGLIAGALARGGRGRAAGAVLAIGAFPLFLGWATVVLKDAQMAACLVGATGLVAHWRLSGRRVPLAAGIGAGVLIGYATLVRSNALFATVPLALALVPFPFAPSEVEGHVRAQPRLSRSARSAVSTLLNTNGKTYGWRARFTRLLVLLAALGATIVAGPFINHRILGAERSNVERSPPLYDLAGIAHFARLPTIAGLPPPLWAEAERRGCYTPYFWNPFGEPAQCDFVGQAVAFGPQARAALMRDWARAILAHPLAYAEHRAGHFNANLRFVVGAGEPDAIPPVGSEPNDLGLGAPPTRAGRWLIRAAGLLVVSPFGWPVVWLALALALLWAGAGARGEVARLGRALALSAAIMSASFAVVSLASDLRYHLWSMIATALAAVLLVDGRDRRRARIGGAGVAAVAAIALAARLALPAFHVPLPAYVPPPPTAPR